jgi:membrane protein required for beta-lactamase induction
MKAIIIYLILIVILTIGAMKLAGNYMAVLKDTRNSIDSCINHLPDDLK